MWHAYLYYASWIFHQVNQERAKADKCAPGMRREKPKELRVVRGVAMVGRSDEHLGQVEKEIKID